ncbi:MAG: hypothetical protein A2512_01630 [Deltaproteobacteria bacterium RIFOXYD12_FULL_56_24]|nr:MAG: hypothetical protein A2512_01630 [Deltaproteobacteria bacterium RIFOXYD12_FULL_56_24]
MPINTKKTEQIYSYTDESGKTVFSNIKKDTEINVPPSKKHSFPTQAEKPITQAIKPVKFEPASVLTGNKQIQNTFGMIVLMIIAAMGIRLFFDNLDKKLTAKKKKQNQKEKEKQTIVVHHHHYHEKPPETEKKEPPFEAKQAKSSWTIEFLRSLEWREFEKLCAKILEERGFKTELGNFGPGGDGGKDIRVFKAKAPEKPYGLAQCKAQKSDITVGKIRELRGTMAKENVAKGFFFTSGGFYKIAWEEGKEQKMELVNGDELLTEIQSLPIEKQETMLREITNTDYMTPTCTACGIKMTKRTSTTSNEKFWGCVNYPKCNKKLELRWTDK